MLLLLLAPPLALQGILDVLGNPATAWIIIPILIFGIPIIQAIMSPFTTKIKADEREKMRKMFERITLEKLDVIKTAVAMGYQRSDLQELDSRLEEVIGSSAMRELLEGKTKSTSSGSGGIHISINKDKLLSSGQRKDLDELIAVELGDGLRKREKQREEES
jgi:hypothetical protein